MCAVLLDEAEQLVGDVRLERRLQVRDAAVLRGLVGFSAGVGGRHDGLSDPVRRIVVTFIKLSMHKNAVLDQVTESQKNVNCPGCAPGMMIASFSFFVLKNSIQE